MYPPAHDLHPAHGRFPRQALAQQGGPKGLRKREQRRRKHRSHHGREHGEVVYSTGLGLIFHFKSRSLQIISLSEPFVERATPRLRRQLLLGRPPQQQEGPELPPVDPAGQAQVGQVGTDAQHEEREGSRESMLFLNNGIYLTASFKASSAKAEHDSLWDILKQVLSREKEIHGPSMVQGRDGGIACLKRQMSQDKTVRYA